MKKVLLLFLLPTFVFGQNDDAKRLDSYLKAFTSVNDFNGTVLVIKDNKTIINKSFGFADIEKKTPNSADTKFRIASCGKQFTAIAILQLQEQGKLSVTDKLNKYFPDIPSSEIITLDMLLTHRSGIHDPYTDSTFEKLNNSSLTKNGMLELIKKAPLDFAPGTKYQYSNSGYILLATIIEKASNQTFDQYMNTNIFKKAKMNSSGVDHNDILLPHKANGYVFLNNKLVNALYDNMDASMGCGNLYSTANDIYLYYFALNDTTLLSKNSRQLLLIPKNTNKINGGSACYAYGVIADSLKEHAFFTHGGWGNGFTSDITMYFNDNTLFVVLSNSESDVWGLSKGLQAVLFNVPIIYPYKYKPMNIAPKLLEKYVGQWGPIQIYLKDNSLHLNDSTSKDGEQILIPETTNKFFYAGENDRQIEFVLDKNNKVDKAFLIESGLKKELK